jgi:glycosyltransferase involved in cell wall biosynthesis
MVSIDHQRGVSIIIPAWNEETTISDCLNSILQQSFSGAMQLIIVANGCKDATISRTYDFRTALEERNIQFDVMQTPLNSKTNAINLGDTKACFGKRVYLDADVILSRNAIHEIYQALDVDTPRLVSPKAVFNSPKSVLCRCHLFVFENFPPMIDDVVGMGCYAVNAKGRSRWSRMPQLIADDGYVRSFFSKNERILLRNTYFSTSFPEFGQFFSVLERWHRGNMELNAIGRGFTDESLFRRRLTALLNEPILIILLPIYLLNNMFAKTYANMNMQKNKHIDWIRKR